MGGFNLQEMLAQARQQAEKLQEKMQQIMVEASSGGGSVTVKMNGQKQVLSVVIEPEVVKSGDIEMLQDLVDGRRQCCRAKGGRRHEVEPGRNVGRHGPAGNVKRLTVIGQVVELAFRPASAASSERGFSPARPTDEVQVVAIRRADGSPDRRIEEAARRGRQDGAALRVLHSALQRRRRRAARRLHPPAQGQPASLLGVQQHHRRRSLRLLQQSRLAISAWCA